MVACGHSEQLFYLRDGTRTMDFSCTRPTLRATTVGGRQPSSVSEFIRNLCEEIPDRTAFSIFDLLGDTMAAYSCPSTGIGTHSHISLIHTILTGQNNQAGKSILKTDYKPENTVEQNLKVAVKILLKTMDSATPSPERIELSTLKQEQDGRMVHYTLSDEEVSTRVHPYD